MAPSARCSLWPLILRPHVKRPSVLAWNLSQPTESRETEDVGDLILTLNILSRIEFLVPVNLVAHGCCACLRFRNNRFDLIWPPTSKAGCDEFVQARQHHAFSLLILSAVWGEPLMVLVSVSRHVEAAAMLVFARSLDMEDAAHVASPKGECRMIS